MMRLFWMITLLGGYVWIVSSGKEQLVIETGKAIYQAAMNWLDGADVDFQLKEKKTTKRSRRWN